MCDAVRHRRGLLVATGVPLLLLVIGLASRMVYVHEHTWDWRLAPAAAPTKLEFAGRDYDRGGERSGVPSGETARGETDGGGDIYAEAGIATPTVVYVTTHDRTWAYGLVGGP